MNNEQHTCKHKIVGDDGTLEISTDVTDLLVDDLNIALENTGLYASCIRGKNEVHNKIIHNTVRASFLEITQHENKMCCAA